MSSSPAKKGMSATEIGEEIKTLKKVIHEKQPSENVLVVLDRLEKGVVASEALLKATSLGKLIGSLRNKQNNPQISDKVADKAASMVKKWRIDIGRTEKPGQKNNGSNTPKKTVPSKSSSSQSLKEERGRSNTPATLKISKSTSLKQERPSTPDSSDGSQGPSYRRTHHSDGVTFDIFPAGEDHPEGRPRNKVVELMYNGLANKSKAPWEEIFEKAKECELEFYKKHGFEAKGPYLQQVRSLYQILGNASNPELRHQVLHGSITAYEFVNKDPELFLSAERQEELRLMKQKNMDNAVVPQEVKAVSNMITCPKCKAKKTSYSQAQTRSADEPMTNFCECQACGHRWKFC